MSPLCFKDWILEQTKRKPRKAVVRTSNKWVERYQKAHEEYFKVNSPIPYADGLYVKPKLPVVSKSGGLQKMIENYINWCGYRATRINNIGKLSDKVVTDKSGARFTEKRYTKATRRGAADISSTIKGKSVMWEIKIGADKPSEWQLKEQQKERAAGGEYFFVKTPDDFFEKYDGIVRNF